MAHRKLTRRKVITNQGASYVTLRHTKHGVERMHRVSVNGVKRLAPRASIHVAHVASVAHAAIKHITTQGIDHNPVSTGEGFRKKIGSGMRPTRNLILREISHALRR